jgi:hypothetical protein
MTLCAWLVSFFGEDLIAQIDALVADIHAGIHAGSANEFLDLLLALSAKRAGEINFASFAAALLCGADVTVEFFLNGGDAHAEVAEHPPGTRTRIKRQRGEELLGAHVAAPGLLGQRGRTLDRLTGLGRLLWRPPVWPAPPAGNSSRARDRCTSALYLRPTPCLQIAVIGPVVRHELAWHVPSADREEPSVTATNGTRMARRSCFSGRWLQGLREHIRLDELAQLFRVHVVPSLATQFFADLVHRGWANQSELAEWAPSSRSQKMTFSCLVLSPLAASSGVPCA